MCIRTLVTYLTLFTLLFNTASCKKSSIEIIDKQQQEQDNTDEPDEPESTVAPKGLPQNYADYQVEGGYHVPCYKGSTDAELGYYIFFSDQYITKTEPSAVLIFLHGSGERGNSEIDPGQLLLAIMHGPGKLIKDGDWKDKHDLLVVSVQTSAGRWDPKAIKDFINYLISQYDINERQVYLTGLSMGGTGVYDYLGTYGNEAGIAAAVPICGRAPSIERVKSDYVHNLASTPIWAFHGESDPQVPAVLSKNIVSAINETNPAIKAELTLYPGVGHDSWTMTYDGTGMGMENKEFTPFATDIYSWLYQHHK